MKEGSQKLTYKSEYWDNRWINGETGWDIGYASPPLIEYCDQIEDKSARILIPGAGNAYEAEYLHAEGFNNVFVLDISKEALDRFQSRVPGFPKENLLHEDFLVFNSTFDLILEQTFFCALDPSERPAYVAKSKELLADGGKLVGLLFDDPLFDDKPPFGGSEAEYRALFADSFEIEKMEIATNSIKPRLGRELFVIMRNKLG